MKIGVVALQGDVEEHIFALNTALGNRGEAIPIYKPSQLDEVDGITIPGGESTTIGRLMVLTGLFERIKEVASSLPILGTCAGMVLLAKKGDEQVERTRQPLLGIMDFAVKRNAFGRQRESFETELEIPAIGPPPFRGVFIRAPIATEIWGEAEVFATFQDKIVGVRQNHHLALSFHPELVPEDPRVFNYFFSICKR